MPVSRRTATHHGWVVIDKPSGWTSHDVVARVRRVVGERRVGHAGTLDPAATGVLPVAVGIATRVVEYLAEADKAYRAWVRFGATTDTADAEGTITAVHDASNLSLAQLEPILDAFRGEIQQRPPMYSAVRIDGTRLYQLARRGVEIEVPPRPVTIHALDVVAWDPPVLCIDVTCSKGTYIRALARDIGDRAGVGAHLERLVRSRSGPFTLDDALSIEDLGRRLAEDGWEGVARAPDAVLEHLAPLVLAEDDARAWGHGKPVPLPQGGGWRSVVRAYNADGAWLGIGNVDDANHVVRPAKVIVAG